MIDSSFPRRTARHDLQAGGHLDGRIVRRIVVPLAALALIAAACGSSQAGGSTDGSADDPTVANPAGASTDLSVAMFVPEGDMFSQIYQGWAEDVEQATDITFTPHYGGSLVSITGALDAVRDGTADVALVAPTAIASAVPEVAFLEGTGLFTAATLDDYEGFYNDADAALQGVLEGVELLHWGPSTLHPLYVHREKLLESPADFQGTSIRTAGRLQGQEVALLGGTPTTVDPGELFVALQTGTVDAALFTPTLVNSLGLQEVAPYIVHLPDVSTNVIMWVMNPTVWDSLSAEDRQQIDDISRQHGLDMPSFIDSRETEALATLEDADGVELATLDDAARQEFLDTMSSAVDDAAASARDASPEGATLVDAFGR